MNPLRACLVASMETLDAYKWSGHAVIMGHGLLAEQSPDEVLHMFNASKRAAGKSTGILLPTA